MDISINFPQIAEFFSSSAIIIADEHQLRQWERENKAYSREAELERKRVKDIFDRYLLELNALKKKHLAPIFDAAMKFIGQSPVEQANNAIDDPYLEVEKLRSRIEKIVEEHDEMLGFLTGNYAIVDGDKIFDADEDKAAYDQRIHRDLAWLSLQVLRKAGFDCELTTKNSKYGDIICQIPIGSNKQDLLDLASFELQKVVRQARKTIERSIDPVPAGESIRELIESERLIKDDFDRFFYIEIKGSEKGIVPSRVKDWFQSGTRSGLVTCGVLSEDAQQFMRDNNLFYSHNNSRKKVEGIAIAEKSKLN